MKRTHQRVVRRINQSLPVILPTDVWHLILGLLTDDPSTMLCMLATCHQAIDWMRPQLKLWLTRLTTGEQPVQQLKARMTDYLARNRWIVDVNTLVQMVQTVQTAQSDRALWSLVYVAFFTEQEERLLYLNGSDICKVESFECLRKDGPRPVPEQWFIHAWDGSVVPLIDSTTLTATLQRRRSHRLYRYHDLSVSLSDRVKAVGLFLYQNRNMHTLLLNLLAVLGLDITELYD